MTAQLANLFAVERSPVVTWEGVPAYAIWEVDPVPKELIISFLSAKVAPTQGLAIKIDRGIIRVNGEESSHITLWRDTAPDITRLLVLAKPKAKLKVWNVWRDQVGGHDVTNAWVGNAGMRVDVQDTGETVLKCSDGQAEVNFEDLVVSVEAALP